MAEVVERGDFKLDELERKSAIGFAGAREALDVLVYEHGVPYRYAHRVCGELVRSATEGMDRPALVAQTRQRLADYPNVDVEELVLTALGQSTKSIWLNVDAFKSVHAEIMESLDARAKSPPRNAVADAIDNLMAEGARFAG
jgi:argininosuccinate lyase